MKNLIVITTCALLAILSSCSGGEAVPEESGSLPNVVFIMADDMGYGDPSFNNPDSKIQTPNIDRLAEEGMRFTDAHAPAAWCVPSRFGLLTGQYPVHSHLDWRHRAVIPAGTETLATMFRRHGYRTAMVGKWHLGFDGGPDYDFDKPMTGGPLDHGFDSYFGIPASLDIPPYYYIRDRHPVAPPTNEVEASYSEGWTRIQGAFWRDGGIAPGFEHVEVLPAFEKETVKVINSHKGKAEPLFLYMALPAPHTPWLPTEEFQGKSQVSMYGDFMLQVDHTVGQVLDALDGAGLGENTLVVFTSDNGPVWYAEDVERFGHNSVGSLRGMKADAWEGGHRVPFVVRWPGKVAPGSTSDQLVSFTDMMATFSCAVGEKPAPAEETISILPVLLDKEPEIPLRERLVVKEDASVMREGHWKLITHLGSGGFSKPRKVEPEAGGPQGQLYNLAEDLGEQNNLWSERPEVVERLQQQLAGFEPDARSAP